jgi:hypothetical protein
LILSVQPLLFDGFVVDDGVPSSKGSTEFLPLRLLEPGLLSIRADRFPFIFAVLKYTEGSTGPPDGAQAGR